MLFCVGSALAGVLFTNLSWVIASTAVAALFVYGRSMFLSEIEGTKLDVERTTLDEMVFAGEPISVKVDVLNKTDVPVVGVVEDMLPPEAELAGGANRITTVLQPRTITSLNYSIRLVKRGTARLGKLKIHREDTLGLFSEEQAIGEQTAVSAHTRKASFDTARRIAGKEHFEYAGVSRMPAAILREQEFQGIREYVPGDRVRDIFWKAYPKLGKLLTKTYVKEGSLQTMIFVDCGRSMRLMKGHGIAKVDHAVDLSMQLSNVLLSSLHPTGVAVFDEVSILQQTRPSLGRHQFETIVRVLKKAPASFEGTDAPESTTEPTEPTEPLAKPGKANDNGDSSKFLSVVARLGGTGKGIGLEGAMKKIVSQSKGQEQLFIVVSDLVSSRDAVLLGARLCKRSGNRMLVLHTCDDWYKGADEPVDVAEAEQLYSNMTRNRKMEAMLRGAGASYLRIGPADTTSRIVRSIRRGVA